jgi:transporter family-2 protein
MWGFVIAMISGALMSIQGVFNSDVTKNAGVWTASAFVQFTALLTCIVMWFFNGRNSFLSVFSVERKYALLGGVIGAFITYTVIRSIDMLGTANAILIIVITQTTAAYLIELFGLFGSEKSEFSWMKLLGLAIAIGGVVLFNLCGSKSA